MLTSLSLLFLGPEAKKTFYKLRQRFVKEWRRYLAHQKGKSGQGASAQFESAWPLFEDCRFLGDHITPRKYVHLQTSVFQNALLQYFSDSVYICRTRSTYKSSATTPIQNTKKTLFSLPSSSAPSPSPASSDCSMSSLWNSDVEILTASGMYCLTYIVTL